MTRKDYVLIADAIRETMSSTHEGYLMPDRELEGVQLVAIRLACVLSDDNPRFNRETFLRACTPKA